MKFRFSLLVIGLAILGLTVPKPPNECNANYNFAALDQATIKSLTAQGSMVVVRQHKDLSLINVTAAQVVNAPVETVWEALIDFKNYPRFLPQTAAARVVGKAGEQTVVEQTLAVKFWQLPSVDITYQLAYRFEPYSRIRFWWASGSLQGTYGGWDLVPAGRQTLLFYTLYSNLTSLGWGLGGMMKSQPDFMAGINVTTAMMTAKAAKEESERRARK